MLNKLITIGAKTKEVILKQGHVIHKKHVAIIRTNIEDSWELQNGLKDLGEGKMLMHHQLCQFNEA